MEKELDSDEGSLKRQFEDGSPTPEETLISSEQKNNILSAIECLSTEHKTVIVLRDIEGLSYDEISEITSSSLGTVKSRISRARQRLKEIISSGREQDAFLARQSR